MEGPWREHKAVSDCSELEERSPSDSEDEWSETSADGRLPTWMYWAVFLFFLIASIRG